MMGKENEALYDMIYGLKFLAGRLIRDHERHASGLEGVNGLIEEGLSLSVVNDSFRIVRDAEGIEGTCV